MVLSCRQEGKFAGGFFILIDIAYPTTDKQIDKK